MCLAAGAACTANSDCCDGFCDPATLTCGVPPSCVPLGGTCAMDTDCCNGSCNQVDHVCGVIIG